MSELVVVRHEPVVLPTYEPHAPDKNPMFLEKRVFQGSSGRVYPLPFTDRSVDAKLAAVPQSPPTPACPRMAAGATRA